MRSLLTLVLFLLPAVSAQARNLDIYWVDVEGGAATLIVSPTGESMLIDTGWNERDATRIFAAAQLAGLKKIDYVVVSHYHTDHVGGLASLTKLIPTVKYYGRNDVVIPADQQWLDSYRSASAGKRTIVKPGDVIPIKGFESLVVAADGKLIEKVQKGGGTNPLCATAEQKEPAGPENQNMVGTMLTYGKFKMLALIDLDWEKEIELACPVNRLGKITVYQSGRHGSFDGAGAPGFLNAITPQVVVVNNGPRKGLGQRDNTVKSASQHAAPYEQNAYLRMTKIPGVEGIWQGHRSLVDADPNHNTAADMIANFEETTDCKGNWIKASVEKNGKFTITNGRNGFSKTYQAR